MPWATELAPLVGLSRLFADIVKRVQVPVDVSDSIAEALRESQSDKERYQRTALMQLQPNDLPLSREPREIDLPIYLACARGSSAAAAC